ncbi:MAG: hypothetical protein AB8D78_04710 [Akkermansiaceae bacterium]
MQPVFRTITCLWASTVLASAEMQTFVGDNGQTMKAELVSHSGGKVKIKRNDGKEFEVDPSIFREADTKIIRKWMASEPETIRYDFKIDAEKKMVDRDGTAGSSGYTKWAYEISITNASQDTISDLKIFYRVFYYYSSDKMIEGEEALKDDLAFNRSLVIKTTPVSIYRSRYSSNSRKNGLKGCLVRIVDSNGKVVQDWVSKEVGMKGKIWQNTNPREQRPSGGALIR